MTQHTPGPWAVSIHEVDGARSIRIISPTGGVIALCKAAQGNKEGNAHLIAAAPELLTDGSALNAAAEALLDKIAHVTGVEHERRALIAAQVRHSAAITKAEAAAHALDQD